MRNGNGQIATKNERTILNIIHRNPGVSRSELTHMTEWKQQSVHRLVDGLLVRGLVTVSKSKPTGPGKPSLNLRITDNAGYAVGFLINTDAIEICIVDLGCRQLGKHDVECDPSDREGAIAAMAEALKHHLDTYSIDEEQVVGIGIAITGVRQRTGEQFRPPEPLANWRDVPLVSVFSEVLQFPVWAENNATAGAIAEALVGAGLEHDTFAYLSFNHGFGAGIIVDGMPLKGAHMNAGELGVLFMPDGMQHRPALGELRKRLRARGKNITSIRQMVRDFEADWPSVDDWVAEVTPALNHTLCALWGVMDPSAIVFGGEAPASLQEMLIARAKAFDSPALDVFNRKKPVLLKSCIDGDAACFGAALLPLKNSVFL